MTASPTRVLSGPDLIRAETRVRELMKRRELSPYPWQVPPPDADRVHAKGGIGVPAANTVTQILAYTVPANRWFWLTGLIQLYLGGTSTVTTPGDGQIAWDLDVDIPTGIASPQGYQVNGFSEILGTVGLSNFPYGNFQQGLNTPYLLSKPELIGPEKTLRSKVTVNSTVHSNGGNFVTIFDGWLVPTDF